MKKRRKAYSVDAVVRFFLHYYNIPTKQDIEKVLRRLDQLEATMRASKISGTTVRKPGVREVAEKGRGAKGRADITATETVLRVLKRSPKGVDIPGLKAKSGFGDKKVRNIIFRLFQQGAIKRVGRGIYTIR